MIFFCKPIQNMGMEEARTKEMLPCFAYHHFNSIIP
jgi:hypothetical protein